jgi:hypothetical protein
MKQPSATFPYKIRLARAGELSTLLDVERFAGARFSANPALADITEDLTPHEELHQAQRAGRVWVATGPSGGIRLVDAGWFSEGFLVWGGFSHPSRTNTWFVPTGAVFDGW